MATEAWYYRLSWLILAIVGALAGVIALSTLFVDGYTPDTDTLIASFGIGFAITTVAIASTAFRRGERWAWIALAFWPIFFGWHVIALGTWIPDAILLALTVIALGIAAPRAFARAS